MFTKGRDMNFLVYSHMEGVSTPFEENQNEEIVYYCKVRRIPLDEVKPRMQEWELKVEEMFLELIPELVESPDLQAGYVLSPVIGGTFERYDSIDYQTSEYVILYRVPCRRITFGELDQLAREAGHTGFYESLRKAQDDEPDL